MRLIKKFIFSFFKPKIILIKGKEEDLLIEATISVLGKFLKFKKVEKIPFFFKKDEILIFKSENDFNFLIEKSSLPIFILTHFEDPPLQEIYFASEKKKVEPFLKIVKNLPVFSYLILNHDDETVRELSQITRAHPVTFGFSKEADLIASDIKMNKGLNFKLQYNGSLLPVWLERVFGKEQIYTALAVFSLAKILKINLVEVSMAFKNYKSLPGKMRLIEGINGSFLLDDSESATVFSMIEALEILGKLNWPKRKIAVLGDVIGIGKYTIEAHETIGERVKKNADLLFTFGPRAKFIAKGAFENGMGEDKIFSFDKIEDGIEKLKKEIREGDLILVDGSKEMKMSKIVEELKAFKGRKNK
jgi:UDP-N-acetylmuramoyl-tripeptide--D-alanyl-D-alanine ligase